MCCAVRRWTWQALCQCVSSNRQQHTFTVRLFGCGREWKLQKCFLYFLHSFRSVRLHVTPPDILNAFLWNFMFWSWLKFLNSFQFFSKSNANSGNVPWTLTCILLPSAVEHAKCSAKWNHSNSSYAKIKNRILSPRHFPCKVAIELIKMKELTWIISPRILFAISCEHKDWMCFSCERKKEVLNQVYILVTANEYRFLKRRMEYCALSLQALWCSWNMRSII
jgi:hypothetical protein